MEDEENLHEALKLNLELEGYDVTSAFDGAAALKASTGRILRPDHTRCNASGNGWYSM